MLSSVFQNSPDEIGFEPILVDLKVQVLEPYIPKRNKLCFTLKPQRVQLVH